MTLCKDHIISIKASVTYLTSHPWANEADPQDIGRTMVSRDGSVDDVPELGPPINVFYDFPDMR